MKPNILIVNDDGILSPGIKALAEALESLGSITIVAPEKEQSGKSHSISLNTPIRIKPVKLKKSLKGWSVLGTPVDSAKIALKILLKMGKKIDSSVHRFTFQNFCIFDIRTNYSEFS